MIKKYKEFLNEKLSDKLSGFNEQSLKQQFLNGEIDIFKYRDICKQNNIEFNFDENIPIFLETHDIIDFLNLSIDNRYIDGIKYVFENSYNLYDDILNDTLVKVSMFGDIDIITILVDLGADVHTDNEQALLNAINWNTQDVIRYLNEQGADINLLDQDYIIKIIDMYDTVVFNYVLTNYKLDDFLNKMLVKAAETYYFRALKIIIDNGADVHTDNELPLQTAVYGYNFKTTEILLERGANVLEYLYVYVNSNDYLKYQYSISKKIKELINKYYEKQHN